MAVLFPQGWAPPIGYANGIVVPAGRLVFIAGQVGWDEQQRFHSNELRPQFEVVIDFAVEYDPNAPILIRKGLMASLKVDDAKPTHGEPNVAVDHKPFIIRTTMRDLAIHFRENVRVNILTRAGIENSADPAHD